MSYHVCSSLTTCLEHDASALPSSPLSNVLPCIGRRKFFLFFPHGQPPPLFLSVIACTVAMELLLFGRLRFWSESPIAAWSMSCVLFQLGLYKTNFWIYETNLYLVFSFRSHPRAPLRILFCSAVFSSPTLLQPLHLSWRRETKEHTLYLCSVLLGNERNFCTLPQLSPLILFYMDQLELYNAVGLFWGSLLLCLFLRGINSASYVFFAPHVTYFGSTHYFPEQ